MTGLQVFQILKARMGEREAEAFVSYVDENRRQMLADCHSLDVRFLRHHVAGHPWPLL